MAHTVDLYLNNNYYKTVDLAHPDIPYHEYICNIEPVTPYYDPVVDDYNINSSTVKTITFYRSYNYLYRLDAYDKELKIGKNNIYKFQEGNSTNNSNIKNIQKIRKELLNKPKSRFELMIL